jgi:hypothetical protein
MHHMLKILLVGASVTSILNATEATPVADASKVDAQQSKPKAKTSVKKVKAAKAKANVAIKAKADEKETLSTADVSKKEDVAAASPSVNEAETPKLNISGFSAIQWGAVSQKVRANGTGGTANQIGIGASDLYFTVTGATSSGITYKWRSNIAMISNKNPIIDRNYIEVGGNFGTFQIGSLTGPEDTMPQSTLNILGGANTIDGALGSYYNMSAGVISGVAVLGTSKRASKIVYTTPSVNGVQVGIAYTPNTSLRGNSGPNSANPNASSSNPGAGAGNDKAIYPKTDSAAFGLKNVSVGVTYKNTWDDFSLALAAVMVTERSRLVLGNSLATYAVHNQRSFDYSATLGYKDLRWALGYIDNGKSRLPKQAVAGLGDIHQGNSGKAWNTGLQYTKGAYQFGLGYFNTKRKTDASSSASSDIFAATVDFKAFQGLKFFGEFDVINSRTNAKQIAVQSANGGNTTGNNRGQFVALGTKVSF